MRYFHLAWLTAMLTVVQAGPHVPSPPCDNPLVAAASKVIVKSGLQPFCSSVLGFTAPTTTTTSTTTVTPTSIYVDIIYATTYFTTVSYTDIKTVYTTNPIQRRSAPFQAPLPLKTFPASIISSACKLAVPGVTATTTVTSTAPDVTSTISPTELQSLTSYSLVATATTTVGADCGLISRESLTGQGGFAGQDTGLANCTIERIAPLLQEPIFFFYSFAIGTRPDGITYCELYQFRKAKQVIAETTSKGDPNFTFYDRECFANPTTTSEIVAPTGSL